MPAGLELRSGHLSDGWGQMLMRRNSAPAGGTPPCWVLRPRLSRRRRLKTTSS